MNACWEYVFPTLCSRTSQWLLEIDPGGSFYAILMDSLLDWQKFRFFYNILQNSLNEQLVPHPWPLTQSCAFTGELVVKYSPAHHLEFRHTHRTTQTHMHTHTHRAHSRYSVTTQLTMENPQTYIQGKQVPRTKATWSQKVIFISCL